MILGTLGFYYHENYFGELYPNPISSVIYLGFFNKIL